MYTLQPIQFYGNANDIVEIPRWEIPDGNIPVTLYFVLQKSDALGKRRFLLPASGTTVSIEFPRSRPATTGSSARTISKVASFAAPQDDRSLFMVQLSATETPMVLSGTIRLLITQGGATTAIPINYIVKRSPASPGF